MSLISHINEWFSSRSIKKHYRFPALAEINKAIFALEEEIVDRSKLSHQLEHYVAAQETPERDRDTALIPYYFELERFVIEHPPPVTKRVITKAELRSKVRETADLDQMNPLFRLVFLPDNEQADYLLMIGLAEVLNFLLTSLGHIQLTALISEKTNGSPLRYIVVKDDGVVFDEVHRQMSEKSLPEVTEAYQQAYSGLYAEVEKLFGASAGRTLIDGAKRKIEKLYDSDLVSSFLNALPVTAQ